MRAFMALAIGLAVAVPAIAADRVKDLARFAGVRGNALVGYGLVVGLPGTGDDNLPYTLQSMKSAISALGVQLAPGPPAQLKNSAVVMITAELPAFASPGQRIDISVAALGRAKSLRGGTLLMAPLKGADGATYAIAQGQLTVGGFGAEGADGSKVVVNTPTSGRISGGAMVERGVATPFGTEEHLTLQLLNPGFSTARAVADAINATMGGTPATAIDSGSVRISAPGGGSRQVALAAALEDIRVALPDPPARVVVNARTGTVVIGGNVRILPAAVAHGNLTVRVTEDIEVSQPNAFGRGDTAVTPRSTVEAEEAPTRMALFNPGVRLSDLVDAVNALGAAPGDLVAILEALKEAGALRAELVII